MDNVREIASIQQPSQPPPPPPRIPSIQQQPWLVQPRQNTFPIMGIPTDTAVWNDHSHVPYCYSNHPAVVNHLIQQQQQQYLLHLHHPCIRTRKILPHSPSPPIQKWQSQVPLHPSPLHPFALWRQQMYDWSCLVVDKYHIHRECVTLSFNLLDRYICYELSSSSSCSPQRSPSPPITRDDYQLFSMTCLYIAIKLLVGTTTMMTTTTKTTVSAGGGPSIGTTATTVFHSIRGSGNGSAGSDRSTTNVTRTNVTKITIQTFVHMSQHYYSKDVIERTESDIVFGLDWYLHSPTSTSYVRLLMQLVSLLPLSHHPSHHQTTPHASRLSLLEDIERMAYDITEIAIVHSYFGRDKAIDIALAAIFHALRIQQLYQDYNDMNTNRSSGLYKTGMITLDCYWTALLRQLPILQQKQSCPNFQRVYIQLAKLYCQ